MSDDAAAPEPAPSDPPQKTRRPRLSTGKKLGFALVTVLGLIGVTEGFFRVREWTRSMRRHTLSPRVPDTYRHLVLKPNTRFESPSGFVMETNSLGMREKEVSAEREPWVKQRILCVGGSTTFGLYTSANDKTWPAQVQRILHERGYPGVEVLNGGVPAWDLRTSQTNLELRLYDLKPDVVICYHAYNDLVANLDPRYAEDSKVDDVSELWRPLRASAFYRFLRKHLQDPGEQLRKKAETLSDEGTAGFERNLRRFVRRTREVGAQPVICSYPSALRPTLEESEAAGVPGLDRWFGDLSPFAYPTLIEGLKRYNATITKVTEDEGIPRPQVAEKMPHDVKLYASTVHHTDEGEVLVAQIVAQALIDAGIVTK
ncbi:MAG TPA: hypothetical protein DEA08_19435 [Planctomycetes bacterium]|nr:hypothetical protein [Planctomycetota bacterium]